jgi:hypothetical protein
MHTVKKRKTSEDEFVSQLPPEFELKNSDDEDWSSLILSLGDEHADRAEC